MRGARPGVHTTRSAPHRQCNSARNPAGHPAPTWPEHQWCAPLHCCPRQGWPAAQEAAATGQAAGRCPAPTPAHPRHSSTTRLPALRPSQVAPCPLRYAHTWAECPYGHAGERARRRDPRTHNFAVPTIACQSMKQVGPSLDGRAVHRRTGWRPIGGELGPPGAGWWPGLRRRPAVCPLAGGAVRHRRRLLLRAQ